MGGPGIGPPGEDGPDEGGETTGAGGEGTGVEASVLLAEIDGDVGGAGRETRGRRVSIDNGFRC